MTDKLQVRPSTPLERNLLQALVVLWYHCEGVRRVFKEAKHSQRFKEASNLREFIRFLATENDKRWGDREQPNGNLITRHIKDLTTVIRLIKDQNTQTKTTSHFQFFVFIGSLSN